MPGGKKIVFILLPLAICSCASMLKPSATVADTDVKSDAVSKVIEDSAGEKSEAKDEEKAEADPVAPTPLPKPRTAETPKDKDSELAASEIENLTIDEVIRIEEPNTQNLYDNSRYDFPITMNSRVEGWIDYFTGRGRPHMERYLARSSRYIPAMKQILKKSGMPEDLVYLSLIESGFNLRAKSRAKAVGPWQFMKPTGQRYGLRVDAWLDERRDPIRSTEAAARYLKDLYLMFESWYLAASAYNAGEYKVLRAIESLKTNNYWRICQTTLLRRETKDYVPKLIAAAIIAKNPARYGFDEISYMDPLEFDTITIDFPMQLKDIAKLVDASEEDLEDLNPELRRAMVPPGGAYEVRIPVGSRVLAERAIAAIKTKLAPADMPTEYVVRSGDTVKSIAKRFHVKPNDLMDVNSLGKKERLPHGAKLVIPNRGKGTVDRETEAPRAAVTAKNKRGVSSESPKTTRAASSGPFTTHVVRRGETLWSISEKYNVTVQELFRWNHLRKSALVAGKRLKVKKRQADSSNDD